MSISVCASLDLGNINLISFLSIPAAGFMDRTHQPARPTDGNRLQESGKRWRIVRSFNQSFYRLRSPSEWFFWSKFFDESTIANEVGNLVMSSPLPEPQEIVFGRRAPFSSVSLLPSYELVEFSYWSLECDYGEQLVSLALFCEPYSKTAFHERVSMPAIPENDTKEPS